jgi:regulator of replication initiation timing
MKNPETKNNPLQKWVILLSVLVAIFLVTALYFCFFATPKFNKEYAKTFAKKEYLQTELDSLLYEHERIKVEYGTLSEQLSEKDSVILANANEIRKLIAEQADYRKIKRQLERLQNIAKEYVAEIDQLYTENQQLKEENTQVKANLAESKREIEVIRKDKAELDQTISSAAVHQAYNVNSRAVYFKSKNKTDEIITEKANRVEQIKTTFILGANSLIPTGPVTLYCRIAVPGTGRILAPGAGDAFAFDFNGERLQYSAKKIVNYNNHAETVSISWDLPEGDKAVKGKYIVQIYTENLFLGETSFELK